MELKHTNPNCETVLTIKFNPNEIFVLKKCKNRAQKRILYVIFSKLYFDSLQNKMLNNFHITNPNGMDQSFLCKKNTIYKKTNL